MTKISLNSASTTRVETKGNMNIFPSPPRFLSLWAINDALDESRLCGQLDAMHRDGLDGVVFHPRNYPDKPGYLSPDYLRIVSRVILHARDIGMAFWIYDENGYPSGIANGELVRQFPESAGGLLTLHEGDAPDAWQRFTSEGKPWHLRLQRTREIDYLSPVACGHFLELVHDRYRDGLDPAAWAHVEAIFTDEPEFGLGVNFDLIPPNGAIPWSPTLPEIYRQRLGREIHDELPAIFFPTPDGSHKEVRVRFWEFMTDRLCEGFFEPYHAWCRREGKLFTGHLKGEEHPLFQVMMNGSCHQALRHFDIPGIDSLERFPAFDYYPREVGSAAHQFGTGRAMAEAMGGAGWGARPEDLERFLLWLSNNGVTDFVLHLYQYRLKSQAIRDWPPSTPNGLTWRNAFPEVLRRVRQKTNATAVSSADTLVLAPYREIMANYEPWMLPQSNVHNCATYPDSVAGRINADFLDLVGRLPAAHHFADERSLEDHGRVDGDQFLIGKYSYTTIVLADGCRPTDGGQNLLREFEAGGGRVVFAKDIPAKECIEANPRPSETCELNWDSSSSSGNDLLLVPVKDATPGWWVAEFEIAADMALSVEFADDILHAELDGKALDLESSDEGSRAALPPAGTGRRVLRFQPAGQDMGPVFVWLHGEFRVLSLSPWESGPDGTIRTAGPWVIEPVTHVNPNAERIASGWPFASGVATLHGSFTVEHNLPAGSRIATMGTAADAARILIDGIDCGWTWGPDWSVALPVALDAGFHRIELHLVPSTYNRFGPHRHVDGDRHVVSPDQFTGKKNFADRPGAPDFTLGTFWHFRQVAPPTAFLLIGTSSSHQP